MEFLYAVILPFLFGLFLYTLCKAVITVKRRIQYNRDRERRRLAMRPNEIELGNLQSLYANESMKIYTRPKKELKNGTL